MKKWIIIAIGLTVLVPAVRAQDEKEEGGGFKKENLFTGGSISVSFSNNTFLIGANPVLGYKIAEWIDGGVVVNYQYSSTRDYFTFDDRLRQSIYGGGLFTRLFPFNFLFAQAQVEHNFITQKYIPTNGNGPTEKSTIDANSVLVGAGYCQGRERGYNSGFFYISVLWDVSGSEYSPYTDAYGRSVPVIRAGINVPLFQGR